MQSRSRVSAMLDVDEHAALPDPIGPFAPVSGAEKAEEYVRNPETAPRQTSSRPDR
jgi:hypothetical protein